MAIGPWLTAAQLSEVDRAMVDDYRIDLSQMMENAGRGLARRLCNGAAAGIR